MARLEGGLAIVAASAIGVLMTACGSGGGTVTKSPQNFTLTIASSNPASGVAIGMTTNLSTLGLAETTPATVTGAASTTYALTAPATAGGNNFSSWSGCTGAGTTSNICEVTLNSNMTVTANYSTPTLATPTVTVTPSSYTVVQGAAFSVTVTVAAPSGDPTPTGSVVLSGSGLGSLPAQALTNGSVTVSVAAGAWTVAAGTYTLTATYTPDTNSSSTYNTATGTSGNITVTAAPPPTTYTLTVDSTNPASGVAVTASPADVNSKSSGSTSFALTYDSGAAVTLTAPATAGGNAFGSWTGCGSTSGTGGTVCSVTVSANTTVTANYTTSTTLITPTVTVTPASPSVNTQQSLDVTVTVGAPSGDPTPTGTVVLSNGNGYTSAATALSGGMVTITVPAGSLSQGLNTLTGTYTPDSGSSATYNPASGTHVVTVNTITPTVTVTPQSYTISNSQALQVTVTVAGPSGDATPTGSVTLTSGTYSSGAQTLTSGSVTITIAAGTLPDGSETLTATYTPDTASASLYGTASGTSSAVTVGAGTTVSVNQSSAGPATTPNILGVNLEAWYDDVGNASAINAALGPPGSTNTGGAGMAAIRWPGGSWSDDYHWGYQTGSSTLVAPYKCTCTTSGGTTTCTAVTSTTGKGWAGYSTFAQFENAIPKAGNFDLALTANYGTNETCTGGGDPSEAAAFAGAAVTDGHPASHMTVGNEVYGAGWEDDLHAKAHDPTTYANAVTGADGNGGYYPLIKAASATTLVGVVVDADGSSSGWDHTVLSGAKGDYDFVEYHYYPQYNTVTSDYNLVHVYGPALTNNINTIKSELSTAGEASTPIYVGELGGNSGLEGTQGWSITQGLFAGQVLGEAMNDGVSRLTWWDGFGNCQGAGNNSPNLYGWQNTWGAENIFSDADPNCPGEGAIGTLSPTARAFQLFSYVAVNGESVLPATVTGADTTDVKAYAATHSGGTALVLFNLNATTAEPVNITLSSATSTTDMQVITYDKEIYDYTNVNCQADSGSTYTPYPCTYDPTHNYSTAVWAPPATTDLGAQNLPYTLVLQPWSINVVIIK